MSNKFWTPVLFYHASCPDGFGAAYAFWKMYGKDMEYRPLRHGEKLPDLGERNRVFFVDIAPSREEVIEISQKVRGLVILDHHISRYEELKDLPFYEYSSEHSGAMMAWNYLKTQFESIEDEEPPAILKYIEDRDIWKWQLKDSEKVLAVLDSLSFNFRKWDEFNEELEQEPDLVKFKGSTILKYCNTIKNKIVENRHILTIKGTQVPAVNTPFFRSEILSEICIDQPFSAGYHYDGEYFVFSLRSTDEGMDVAKIASLFGGGGHRNASGFKVKSLDELN